MLGPVPGANSIVGLGGTYDRRRRGREQATNACTRVGTTRVSRLLCSVASRHLIASGIC